MAIKEIKREWSPEQLGYVKTFLLHTEADVKGLPSCCVGSSATVSETDNEYICTPDGWKLRSECAEGSGIDAKVENLFAEVNKLKSTRPNWNQSNPEAADYVKNRTHYGTKGDIVWDESFASAAGCAFKIWKGETATSSRNSGVKKVSDLTPSIEEVLLNGHVDARSPFDVTEDIIVEASEQGYTILTPPRTSTTLTYPCVIVAFEAGYVTYNAYKRGKKDDGHFVIIPEPGIYFYQTTYESTSATADSFTWDALKQLDESYIPDTIARKTDLEGLGGAFVVNVTGNDTDGYTVDKEFAEILAALQRGETALAKISASGMEYCMPCAVWAESIILFSTIVEMMGNVLVFCTTISSDGSVSMTTTKLATAV